MGDKKPRHLLHRHRQKQMSAPRQDRRFRPKQTTDSGRSTPGSRRAFAASRRIAAACVRIARPEPHLGARCGPASRPARCRRRPRPESRSSCLGPLLARSEQRRLAVSSGQRGRAAEVDDRRTGPAGSVRSRPRRSSRHCRCKARAAARRSAAPTSRQTVSSPARIAAFAATPPATAKDGFGRCLAQIFRRSRGGTFRPERRRRRPGTRRRDRRGPAAVSPPFSATTWSRARSSAVFRPENDMSHPGRSSSGRGKPNRVGSPVARPRPRPRGRRAAAGREAWRSCRRPRRARRRSCRRGG